MKTRISHALLALGTVCVAGLALVPSALGAVAFSRTDYPVGVSATGVAAGNFDGDAWPDLATTIYDTGKVAVMRGTSGGGFATPGPSDYYTVGAGPSAVAAGDIDGDGDQDLVTANTESNDLSILPGLGDGSFAHSSRYPAGAFPRDVELADLDGDGHLDMVAVNEGSHTVSVWLGTGAAGFDPRVDYATGAIPAALVVARLNGDALPDIATANRSVRLTGGASVLYGDAQNPGELSAAVDLPTCCQHAIAAADVDSDGDTDLATGSSGAVQVLANDAGGFAAPAVYHHGVFANTVAAADFDADADVDLAAFGTIALNGSEGHLAILRGNGAGSFELQSPSSIGGAFMRTTPWTLAVTDLDGTYAPDIAVANPDAGVVSVLLNLSPPRLTALQGSLDFGEQPVGTRSLSHAATFTNLGDQWAHVTSATLTGVADDEFMISGDGSSCVKTKCIDYRGTSADFRMSAITASPVTPSSSASARRVRRCRRTGRATSRTSSGVVKSRPRIAERAFEQRRSPTEARGLAP